jgi:uncharacterized membrane protein
MAKPPHSQRGGKAIQQQTRQEAISVARHQWAGPLPPPEALERFESLIPGGAERILSMAQLEQEHRIAQEAKETTLHQTHLDAIISDTKRGQYLGATISILAILGAVISAYFGAHWIVSSSLVGVPILGIVRAITKGRR